MDDNSSFETVITARSGWFDINLRELWRYRDLALLFVRRNFIANYKQTILGPAWAIVQPLLTTVVFTIVFGRLAKLPTDGVPPFLFYMCGNIAWGYFAGCLTATSSTFTGNAAIFGKVYFPRLTMPISTVISQLISFAIQFLFFLGFLAFYSFLNKTVYLTPLIWLLPFFLLQMALLGLGCGIIVSSLTTKYRDLAMLVSFGVRLWMYATRWSIRQHGAGKMADPVPAESMVAIIEARDCSSRLDVQLDRLRHQLSITLLMQESTSSSSAKSKNIYGYGAIAGLHLRDSLKNLHAIHCQTAPT